jgi:polysaccharide export outer membrane protein
VLTQFRRPKVYVVGQVNRPGASEFNAGDRIMEAIAQAGSFGQTSYLAGATLTHQGSKDPIPLDLHKLFYGGDMSQNVALQDGDTIYIPEDVRNRYFVLGEVRRPGRYQLKEGLTVIDAVSEAGGVSERGNAKSTYIVRGDPKNPRRIKVDLPKFLKSADVSQNIALEPGDLVYVPESKKPDWNKIASMLGLIVNSSYLARMWGF